MKVGNHTSKNLNSYKLCPALIRVFYYLIYNAMLETFKKVIIRDAKQYEKKRWIYFLLKWDEIVYIWQTDNFDERIQQHLKTKDFDRYYFDYVSELTNLDILENNLIIEQKPKLNTKINKPKWYLSKKEMKEKYKIWKKFIDKYWHDIHQFKYWKFRFFDEQHILFALNKISW